ncbi:MAG: transcriptional regulator ArgP [Microbacterium sp. SCN 70-27]|uniref:LysR family transcriptional regulator ArgP n=1 Tax=unclassified Microbacterium TaxID=2609290 RepID=UPI00086A5246|nr:MULTISPECIES: LysR family transcriptional regulator ArgP [unclassified Microbacterium]MBN9224006.1 LysR family transcriptional regulator ArgP [Microbacterium sp.]ODT26329.1 MAG: transcriptional regulator ArgP [Microbacterium sp. SCN 70-27]
MRIPAVGAMTLAAVIDAGSLQAAAERLHVSPSAVSQRIRALEDDMGRVLLVRSKPPRPTPAAHAIVRYARRLTLLEDDAIREFGDGDTRVSLPLAVNADSLATWFLAPLARLAARHPVVFDLHRDDQDFTAGMLEEGTVTGAVTSRAQPVAGCHVRALGVLRYEAVASPAFVDAWLAGGADAAVFSHAPVIDFDRRDDLQSRWLTARGVDPAAPPRHRVPASHDFAAATELGLGWALLPRLQSADALAAGRLVALGGPSIDVPLYWQQWNLRSELLDAVADEIVAEGRRVLES